MENRNYYKLQDKILRPPLTYDNFRGVMFFLPISYSSALEVVANRNILPIRISPKRALLGLTVFDFVDCQIGPYRELALTIPVSINNPLMPKLLPLLFPNSLHKYLGLYTIMLAMNTIPGQKHASQMFGYPVYKNILDIEFNLSDNNVEVEIKEQNTKIVSFKENINNKYKTKNRFYHTIFQSDNVIKQVDLSATAQESSSYLRHLTNFHIGEHSISNKIKHLNPSMLSLETIVYKSAKETLSMPHLLKV